MDRVIELGRLFDYYGAFLTARQRALVDAYANEKLTLGELAEREGISRQGVRDGIVRAERQLREMERRLGLICRTERLGAELAALRGAAQALPQGLAQRAALLEGLDRAAAILEEEDGV